MATTSPDSISGWRNISGYDVNDDKNKKKRQNQLAQNTLQKAVATPSAQNNTVTTNKSSGGKSSDASSYKTLGSNKTSGVFDGVKLPYEDTVAQKNAQKAEEKRIKEQKAAQQKAAQEQAEREELARQKYIAQKRQEQRDAQWIGTGGRPLTTALQETKTNASDAAPKLVYNQNKMQVRSALEQNQWNKGTGGSVQPKSVTEEKTVFNTEKNDPVKEMYTVYLTKLAQHYGLDKKNDDMARFLGLDKTEKTAEKQKSVQGPNAQMGAQTRDSNKNTDWNQTAEWLTGGAGENRQIAQTSYLEKQNWEPATGANREMVQSTFVKPSEKSIVQKISDDIYNAKYGMDGLNEVNHTNTLVTKDNVYSLPANEVADKLNEAQTNVRNLRSDKKQQRDEILFKKHLLQAQGYGTEKTAELDKQIKQLDSEINMLNIKDIKANVGYEFCQNYINQLSKTNGDDILKILNEYQNSRRFDKIADVTNSAKSAVNKVSDVVSVLENTKVEPAEEIRGLKVFNRNDPKNAFNVVADYTIEYGIKEYKLSVKTDNIEALTSDQKNLYKALENIPISKEVYDFLEKPADVFKKVDLDNLSKNVAYAGYLLDAVDFVCLVANDSLDGNIGQDTTKRVTSMISSWIGGLAGAELGVAGGAAIGTAILPGVGTVIGGAIGAIVGAYVLSDLGEDIGMFLGGLDYDTRTTKEQHLERGR